MIIGYSVEGSTDRAVITGLKSRWCPNAKLMEGRFRGQTRQSRHREIPKICQELESKNADVIVFLADSNNLEWRIVKREETARCPDAYNHKAIFGVCCRNVECWLTADLDYIANHFSQSPSDFQKDDPKNVVESAFGITRGNKREKEPDIADFVEQAPLKNWLKNDSFEDFYNSLRAMSKALGCEIENLLEKGN